MAAKSVWEHVGSCGNMGPRKWNHMADADVAVRLQLLARRARRTSACGSVLNARRLGSYGLSLGVTMQLLHQFLEFHYVIFETATPG